MTEQGLKRIEGGLAITLPQEYRELMLTRGDELRELNKESGGKLREFLELTANDVLMANCVERKPHSGLSGAYPHWWEQFFLLGTDGGGGYYCLRLDGPPGVWMISSDDDGEPERQYESLAEFVDYFARACREKPE